uniref:Protein kinase domain-containing protein n=1 Tax=Oryza nivara TaxID=4536 RepID=A0A0E0GEP6_ORYNI
MLYRKSFLLICRLSPVTPAASAQQLPGCPDKCGNISVPYPLGIGARCARDFGFELFCNHSATPPHLLTLQFEQHPQLVSLSLADGEARVLLKPESKCYPPPEERGSSDVPTSSYTSINGSTTYRYSPKNRLVALGCPNLGYIVDGSGNYVSGCMSACRRPSPGNAVPSLPGRCTGERCCQSTIPHTLNLYVPRMFNFENRMTDQEDAELRGGTTPSRRVFLVEHTWIDTVYDDRKDFNRSDAEFEAAVPVVLDWAIRNVANCDIAKRNKTDYACRSVNSSCVDSTNGSGYLCNCSQGYEGNPYLDDGCTDINECLRPEKYGCYGDCTNMLGSHTCVCPPGTSGNPTDSNGCHPKDNFTLALKVVTGVCVGVFLLVFTCFWLYLGLQKRKLIRTKQKFFEHNGGVILQQQMHSGGGTHGFRIFSTEELKRATNNFASDRVLGRGGHGVVYKGVLEDKTVVAIKKSKMMEEAETKEFAREMFILSQINHRNVVKLLGCCLEPMSDMATGTLSLQGVALAVVLLCSLAPVTPAASAQQLPGCPDKCGNISIPYPFGIGAGCARDEGFRLNCSNSESPPRLLTLQFEQPQQLVSLSLADGEARVLLKPKSACYLPSPRRPSPVEGYGATYTSIDGSTTYRYSPEKNRLVALGCPNLGYIVDGSGNYVSGCMSACRRPSSSLSNAVPRLPGRCTGERCCQSIIPPTLNFYELRMFNFENGTAEEDAEFCGSTTPCRYVFLVEHTWIDTVYDDMKDFNRSDSEFEAVPVVLDWAIRNVYNCSAAKRNKTDYACRSAHSECFNTSDRQGYRCNCPKGYEGNPYLDDGSIDINECLRQKEYGCYGDCTNMLGAYTCVCPPGTSGNPTERNGCRPKDKFTLALKVVTGVSVGVFLSVFMCFWLYLGLQKRKLIRTKQKFFEQNGGVILQQQMHSGGGAHGFRIFSTEELKRATNNFASDRVLGRGGHGVVYKGVLEDKTVVAIKKSKMMEEAETKEFAREMFILSQINHRNVVKLLGCCLEVEVPMLVYEFVSNGTLYHYIHGKEPKADIPLDTRLRIAAESAEALSYMHSSASPPILHGDVKTANILLDDKFNTKVSDFGASKLAPTDEAEIATLVQGTCGYLDPEYLMTCQLTDKSDVYSFGVVMLELLTRKKALYLDGPEENRSLVSCFTTAMKVGRHQELLDSQVRNEMSAEMLEEITYLLMRCISMNGEERPTMKEVAERLEMLRRYQQHPWVEAEDNAEEIESLLGREQQNANYLLEQQNVLYLEEGRNYTFSM